MSKSELFGLGYVFGLITVVIVPSYIDWNYQVVYSKLQDYEIICENANSKPKAYDQFTLTCESGAEFDISDFKQKG